MGRNTAPGADQGASRAGACRWTGVHMAVLVPRILAVDDVAAAAARNAEAKGAAAGRGFERRRQTAGRGETPSSYWGRPSCSTRRRRARNEARQE